MSTSTTEVRFSNTLDTDKSDTDNKVFIYSNNVRLSTNDLSYPFPDELTEAQLKRMMTVRKAEAKANDTKVKFQYVTGTVLYADTPKVAINRSDQTPFMSCIYRAKGTSIPQQGIVL